MNNIYEIDTNINGHEETQIICIDQDKNIIIGVVQIEHKKQRSSYIKKLFVHEQYRHLGIGSLLINRCCEIAKNSDCKTITLLVNKGNNIVDFYKKLGFRFVYQYNNGDCLLYKNIIKK